jgi:hypothetical protein
MSYGGRRKRNFCRGISEERVATISENFTLCQNLLLTQRDYALKNGYESEGNVSTVSIIMAKAGWPVKYTDKPAQPIVKCVRREQGNWQS